jgi:NitT/TauT family transport system substrate-binding protein
VGTPPLAVLCAEQCDTKVLIPPSKLWPFNPSYGIVVRRALLGENTMLEDFLLLHEWACNLIRNNPEDAATIVASELKVINSPFVIQVLRLSPKYCASVPEAYIGSTMSFIAVLRKLDYIKKVLMQEDIFELTIIKKVHPHPAHYDDPGNLLP